MPVCEGLASRPPPVPAHRRAGCPPPAPAGATSGGWPRRCARCELARRGGRGRRRELVHPVPGVAARATAGGSALDQDRGARADPRAVVGERARALQRLERLEPRLRDVRGDAVGERRGGGARARRVLERVGVDEADLAHQAERGLEVRVALAGEADDQVGGERHVGAGAAQRVDDPPVAVGAVAAAHAGEHAVRAALERQVHVRAERAARRARAPGPRRRRPGAGSCSGCGPGPGSRPAAQQRREAPAGAAAARSWRP